MRKHKFKFGDLMENKIFKKYLKDHLKTANEYCPKNYCGSVDDIVANRNIDLMNIQSKNKIIEISTKMKNNCLIQHKLGFNKKLKRNKIKW